MLAVAQKQHKRRLDPRMYQIAVLSILATYGVIKLDFDITWPRTIMILTVALSAQCLFVHIVKIPRFDIRSPLISALSLIILLRTNSLLLCALAAFITIASKFIIRFNNKHIFNPTNLGIVAMMLVSDQVWVSPGQWGNVAFFGFLIACIGGLVVNRAARSDVTLAFLFGYSGMLMLRAAWLGDPWAIPLHQLQNGALLIFTFFMISDPKTTPDSRCGRILFALIVAAIAIWIQFGMYRTNGVMWALAIAAPFVPLVDRYLVGYRYRWQNETTGFRREPVNASAM